jgi:dTDP-glucose 4,6-dehydratase
VSRRVTLLVTGGAGFIGSNFIRQYLSEHEESDILNLDKLTYAGNAGNLADLDNDPRYRFVRGDIADRGLVRSLLAEVSPQAVVNFAAESHVDRSILDASPFVSTNIAGTLVLLEEACAAWRNQGEGRRFIQISTDEVYGDLGGGGRATEESPLAPSNPYAASKASADLLCGAFFRTHRLPVIITRCTNNYGPYQFPEKVIPLMVLKASRGEKLPVYGDGLNIRDWIHVSDHCHAVDAVLQRGRPGAVYNIGAQCEKQNIEIVRSILSELGQPEDLIDLVRDRPGHDRRYALDTLKIRAELGWTPKVEFAEGLQSTVRWYRDHPEWVRSCLTEEYMKHYAANYATDPHPQGKRQT